MSALRNPVLALALGVLGLAITASFVTLGLALDNPVYELPDEYHWEGLRLDRDFERARRAAELGVRATLDVGGGVCRVRLTMRGTAPGTLRLTLTHATLPARDRTVTLAGSGAGYEAPCDVAPGHSAWRVAIEDTGRTWSVRQRVPDPLRSVVIGAASSDAPP